MDDFAGKIVIIGKFSEEKRETSRILKVHGKKVQMNMTVDLDFSQFAFSQQRTQIGNLSVNYEVSSSFVYGN